MAGTIALGNLYGAYHGSTTIKSKHQRCTITGLTDGDALDCGISLPVGAVPLTATMKVIEGCNKVSTISLGFTGAAAGLLATSSVAAAAVGTIYKGVGASLAAPLATADAVLLTGAVTAGPATTDVVVDIEITYVATDMA